MATDYFIKVVDLLEIPNLGSRITQFGVVCKKLDPLEFCGAAAIVDVDVVVVDPPIIALLSYFV